MIEEEVQCTIKQHRRKLALVLCVWMLLVFVCVWAWTPTFTYGPNTLERNGQRRLGKLECESALMGAKPFYSGPKALASQHLNLGAWHGFQRVIVREPLPARSIEFEYCFNEKDYLLILLNYSAQGFDALKIPSYPTEDASLSQVMYTGGFLSSQLFFANA